MEDIDKKQKAIQTATMTVSLITNFINPFAMTALNIAVPHIGAEFAVSATSMAWIVMSFMFSSVALSVPVGRMADIRGNTGFMKIGILIFAIASVAVAIAPTFPIFIAFRVAQGVGSGMIFATNIAILVKAYPARMRGRVLGLAVAMVYVGMAMGPVVGGVLTHYFGWRVVMYLIAALSVISFAVAVTRLPSDKTQTAEQPMSRALSPVSVVLYICAILLIIYGFTTLMQNILSYIILAAGLATFVVFTWHAARSAAPVIDIRLFRENRVFLASNLAALLNYAATFAVGYLLAIYLQLVRGYSADVSGLILIAQPVTQIIVSLFAGRLSDKKAPSLIASIGMAICASAVFAFVFVGADTSVWYIVVSLLVVGVGFGLFASPNTNAIMSSVSQKDYSIATSVQSTARTMGQTIGLAVITIVINAVVGNVPIGSVTPVQFVFDMRITFAVFAALCVVGVFVSMTNNKKPAR